MNRRKVTIYSIMIFLMVVSLAGWRVMAANERKKMAEETIGRVESTGQPAVQQPAAWENVTQGAAEQTAQQQNTATQQTVEQQPAQQQMTTPAVREEPTKAPVAVLATQEPSFEEPMEELLGGTYEAYGTAALTRYETVNLRAATATNSAVVGWMNRGQTCELLLERDGWYLVRCNGHTGFVYRTFLDVSNVE